MSSPTQNCEYCGSPAHVWFNCTDPKRPRDWKPDRLKKSTAARKDVPRPPQARVSADETRGGRSVSDKRTLTPPLGAAGTQAPPVDTILETAEAKAAHLAPKRGKGRPKTIDDMKAYKAQKARDRRARDKAKEQK